MFHGYVSHNQRVKDQGRLWDPQDDQIRTQRPKRSLPLGTIVLRCFLRFFLKPATTKWLTYFAGFMIFHDDIPIYPICLDIPTFPSQTSTPGVTAGFWPGGRNLSRWSWRQGLLVSLEDIPRPTALGNHGENLLQSYRNDAEPSW